MEKKLTDNKSERFTYISWLNVLSAFAVVILHSNVNFWTGFSTRRIWLINDIIESVFYFAVPIFFMLAGATLLDYTEKYDTKTYFKKRFTKAFIPFIFWSLFAMGVYAMKNPANFVQNELYIDKIFNGIFNTQYMDIYWFFIPLFCVYLSIPLFAHIEKEKKEKLLIMLAGIAFVLNILIPFIFKIVKYVSGVDFIWKFELPVLRGYLFYTIIGYLLHKITLKKKVRIIIYILAIVGLLVHIIGTYCLSIKDGHLVTLFKEYNNLPCVLYSIGIFVFIKNLAPKIKSKKINNIFIRLQKYTFAIYLIHKFIFEPLQTFLYSMNIDRSSILFVLLMTVMNIPICILIAFILKKTPLLKHIVP